MMSVAVLLLCALLATTAATDEEINRCELCNLVGIEQNDNKMIDRCCISADRVFRQSDPKMVDFCGEPHYVLIKHTTNPNINKNDEFKIYLYIEGEGNVTDSSIMVSIPRYLAKNGKVGVTCREYGVKPGYICFYYPLPTLKDPRFSIDPNDYIYNIVTKNVYCSDGTVRRAKTLMGAIDAPSNGINPPYIVNLTIDNVAPEGDHDIVLVYTYTNSNKLYIQKETIKLHVNYWYETKFYQYLLTVVAILSILYFMHYFCWETLKRFITTLIYR